MSFLTKLASCTLFVGVITSCGGGGSADSTSSSIDASPVRETASETSVNTEANLIVPATEAIEVVDYSPDEDLLGATAESSNDLYVETDFDFDQYKKVSINLSAILPDGEAASNRLIKIYSVHKDITEWDDQRLQSKELIFVGKTDARGVLVQDTEFSFSVKKVLMILSAVGLENKTLIDLADTNEVQITYSFE